MPKTNKKSSTTNIDDLILEANKKNLVAEHNDLIKYAQSALTVSESKVLDFIISKIKPTDKELQEVHTSFKEIIDVLNSDKYKTRNWSVRDYNKITNNLRSLRIKEVVIRKEIEGKSSKNHVIVTSWISLLDFDSDGGITCKIQNELSPYLIDLKASGDYTQYTLDDIMQLKKKYSIALYRVIRSDFGKFSQYNDEYQDYKDIDEWKKLLNSPKDFDNALFMRNCIKVATDEINKKIPDLEIDFTRHKSGRTLKGITLNIKGTNLRRRRKNNPEVFDIPITRLDE